MTNSQQTIKLDLSSLLTETSAHSDNKYTSSALELLLHDNRDQYGAGFFNVVGAAVKKGAQQLGPAMKDVIQDAARSVSPLADRGRGAARSAARSVSNAIRNSPERLRALGNQVSNAVRNSPERLRAVAAKARAGSERIQQATQSAIDKFSPRSRPAQQSASNTDQSVVANGNREETGALSDTSSAPVDRDENALFLIQNRLQHIEEVVQQILQLLQSRQ